MVAARNALPFLDQKIAQKAQAALTPDVREVRPQDVTPAPDHMTLAAFPLPPENLCALRAISFDPRPRPSVCCAHRLRGGRAQALNVGHHLPDLGRRHRGRRHESAADSVLYGI